MDLFLWILAGLLAATFLLVGLTQTSTPHDKLAAHPRMAWVDDFAPATVRAIGIVEVLGALGLVLPQATGIFQPLTPTAAVGLALVMVAAMAVHHRRGELRRMLPINGTLLVMAVVVAAGRLAG
jgi:uncharacterized membrane protein